MPTITERFPPLPLDELLPAIASFPTSTLQEQHALIKRLVMVHPTLSLDWGPGHRYRRARRLNPSEARPTNVDGIIWRKGVPAAEGRANPYGFSVIYLADHPDTALTEVRAKDDVVVLSDFEILPGKSIRVAPIGELVRVQRTGRGFLSGNASSTLNDFVNACDQDGAKSLLITDSFLLGCLVDGKDNYEVSSYVAKCIFDKDPMISAVAYPSHVQMGAINFAVRTDDFWNQWGVRAVRCGHATHLAHGYYNYTQIQHVTGITVDGTLCWSDELVNENTLTPLEPLWVQS